MIGGLDKKIKKAVKDQNNKIKYLTQGSYGCVYHPGFTCNGKLQSQKYITKIEIKEDSAVKEFEIGEYLRKKMRLFRTMFSPILSYCPISVSKINQNVIKQCDLFTKKNKILYSTKIKYVGEKSLEPFLYSFLQDETNTTFFITELFETHLYLTNSIKKLIQLKVVHYDIKENNVLYDTKQFLPIIIDFGLSFRIDLLTTDVAYKKAFYVYVSTCEWWCLETVLVSFIIGRESWMEKEIGVDNLLKVVDDYFVNNRNMQIIANGGWEKDVNVSKEKWKTYIKREFSKKNGKYIVEDIMQSWDTWDMFSLSYMYFSFLQDICMDCLSAYQDFLVKYMLSLPQDRISVVNYYNTLFSFSEKYVNLEEDKIEFNKNRYQENNDVKEKYVSTMENKIYSSFSNNL
jgi:serine/threonine protein kinase